MSRGDHNGANVFYWFNSDACQDGDGGGGGEDGDPDSQDGDIIIKWRLYRVIFFTGTHLKSSKYRQVNLG